MQIAGAAVDVMDIQGASVMISVDDGMDITPQISSLTQLLMDPYYRYIIENCNFISLSHINIYIII